MTKKSKTDLGRNQVKAGSTALEKNPWSVALEDDGAHNFGLKKATRRLQGVGTKGKWIPADCWADCGSKGYNKAYVEDGVVVKMGTDDTIPDSFDRPQLRACARGPALRSWLLGADRLKYPMKRKHWAPGGGDKALRGKDEWVRISWDEALDILANELSRIKQSYGNEAILAPFIGVIAARPLAAFGGFVDQWGGHSGGTWTLKTMMTTGFMAQWNDRYDLLKTKLFVMWGANPVWSQAGLPAYTYYQAKKEGTARFVAVDPFYNPTYEMLTDDWIPIRPATDTAMLLGMIHTLLVEDDPESNPLINWDFLFSCTVGFDAEHMPEGADPDENLKDYVLGTFDGVAKDAVWASEICGAPAEQIRWLAREIAREENVSICTSGGPARVDNADSLPQAFMAFGAMTGHIGKSGSMVSVAHHFGTNGGPQLVQGQNSRSYSHSHTRGVPLINPLTGNLAGGFSLTPRRNSINLNEINTAVLSGKYTLENGEKKDVNIQFIYHAHGGRLNQLPNAIEGIEAHRKVEFVVTQNMFMNADAIYSDLVLPVTSRWEREGNVCIGYKEQLLWHSRVMDPYFEAKDDQWISVELAKRLGIDPRIIEPWSWKQEIFNQVADARVAKDDAKNYEPLVTITEKDLEDFGVKGVPQEGRIPVREFESTGIYHYPRSPDDNHRYVYLKSFRDDPVKNPLPTASGKLEIHCQRLADYVNAFGWSTIRPIPTYTPPLEGYEATFNNFSAKEKGEYPLQLYNIHMPRQAHGFWDSSKMMRELFPHEFIMHPIDAQARGISNGDSVLIKSRWGKVLRTVWVSPRVMPGVTILGQGARLDYDEEAGVDRGGCANVLKGSKPTGGMHMGWNSVIVEVEKWLEDDVKSDYENAHIIPLLDIKEVV